MQYLLHLPKCAFQASGYEPVSSNWIPDFEGCPAHRMAETAATVNGAIEKVQSECDNAPDGMLGCYYRSLQGCTSTLGSTEPY